MRKLFLSVLALGFAAAVSAQSIVDNAIIPVSVNVNTIMRMNVTSGGNIEFAFNTINDYTNGIVNSSRYDTKFTVASSVKFDVTMVTEDANLVGSDNSSNTINLDLVGFKITNSGTATPSTFQENWTNLGAATGTGISIVQAEGGDASANVYTINWACGVPSQGAGTGNTMLAANAKPDRYSTNIFLTLTAQ
ncbi:MAG: hypothetical protein MJ069_10145 [Salinivirgaceae bacterium]|nr:hypothetical protein [Salinivirgaceae bacterium]